MHRISPFVEYVRPPGALGSFKTRRMWAQATFYTSDVAHVNIVAIIF